MIGRLSRSFATLAAVLILPGACEQRYSGNTTPPPSSSRPTTSTPRKPALPPGPLAVPNSGLPSEVDDILKRKCRRCHTTPRAHGAPFPLLTWQDTQKPRHGKTIAAFMGTAVRSGFMPYRIRLEPPVEKLTDAEKSLLLDWVDSGAPNATSGWVPGAGGAGGAGPPR